MDSEANTPLASMQPTSTWLAYIGLGGNLQWAAAGASLSPEQTLQHALEALQELGSVKATSSFWRTEPVGPIHDQPPFINAIAVLETRRAPRDLLDALLALERRFGRVRGTVSKGPRTLDLDLLLVERVGATPGATTTAVMHRDDFLTLPHPEMHTRRFVLAPLAEVAPGLRHPLLAKTVEQLLQQLDKDGSAERLPGTHASHPLPGRLEVITGPMFSGKSEELIRRLRRAEIARLKTVCFKPELDTRSERDSIASHSRQARPAVPVADIAGMRVALAPMDVEVVGIDECQFFVGDLASFVGQLILSGRRVVVAGLDMTFAGEPFGPVPHLMAIADEVLKLSAVCMVCGAPAIHSQRLGGSRDTVLVGANEAYEARCRAHFHPRGDTSPSGGAL